jgi:hypothetical protein
MHGLAECISGMRLVWGGKGGFERASFVEYNFGG